MTQAPPHQDGPAGRPDHAQGGLRVIGRGGVLMSAAMMGRMALRYGTAMLIGRGLGAGVFGDYGLMMGIDRITQAFADSGLPQANLKFVARSLALDDHGAARKVVNLTTALSVGLSTVLLVLLWLLAPWVAHSIYHRPELVLPIRIAALSVPAVSIAAALLSVLQAAKDIVPTVLIARLGAPAVFLLGAGVVVLIEGGLNELLWAYVIAMGLGLVASVVVLLRWLARHTGAPREQVALREIISFSIATFVATVGRMVLNSADVLILGKYVSSAELGAYVAASRTAMFVGVPINAINPLLSPVVSDLFTRGDMHALTRVYRATTRWTTGGGLGIVAPMLIVPSFLMGLFGEGFLAGAAILIAVGLGELVDGATGGVGTVLNMTGGQKFVAITTAVAAAVLVGSMLLVCPVYGALGGAICLGVVRGGMNLVRVLWLWLHLRLQPFDARYGISWLATTILMVGGMLLARAGGWWQLVAVVLFYLGFVVVLRYGWTRGDHRLLGGLRRMAARRAGAGVEAPEEE